MPKTNIDAFFPGVPDKRIKLSPLLDEWLDRNKTAVLEFGMQKGNIAHLTNAQEQIARVNEFNDKCRSLGIPIIHIGAQYRKNGIDTKYQVQNRLLPLLGKDIFPASSLVEGSVEIEFLTDVKSSDYKLFAKRLNAFEASDLEFLLKVLKRNAIVLVGLGVDCYGLATGYCGICKDFKAVCAEDIFSPLDIELNEGAKEEFSLFIGLVVKSAALISEYRAQKL